MVPVSGTTCGFLFKGMTGFRSHFFDHLSFKARALWQWWAATVSHIPDDKRVIVLNLDETSVKFFYPPGRGLRIAKADSQAAGARCRRNTTKGQQRKALSYIAVICSDLEVQKKIPQIAIVAKKICPQKIFDALPGSVRGKVQIWREASGWNNNDVFARLIKVLAAAVKSAAPDAYPILLMDAHKVHYADKVLRAARAGGLRVLILPASCTHHFQVLDTDVFARFKVFFRQRLQQRMTHGANADLPIAAILEELGRAVQEIVVGTDWSFAFHKNGFGPEPFARASLLEALQWDALPAFEKVLPSYDGFRALFPMKATIPFDLLLRPLQHRDAVILRAHSSDVRAELVPEAPSPVEPWSRRLRPRRSRHELELPAEASPVPGAPASSSSSPCPPLPPPAVDPPAEALPRMLPLPRVARLGRAFRRPSERDLPSPP